MPLDGDQHRSVPLTMKKFIQALKDQEELENSQQWDKPHQKLIQGRLEKHLGPEFVSTRPAPGGHRVSYLEGWRAIQLANDTFGFNGWSSEVREINLDFCDQVGNAYFIGVSATIRVTLKDGTFHEDVGFGHIENSKSKALGFDKCRKEATTDALKRALRKFGNALGNSLYNKNVLNFTKNMKKQPFIVDKDNLIREADFSGGVDLYNAEKQAAFEALRQQQQKQKQQQQSMPSTRPVDRNIKTVPASVPSASKEYEKHVIKKEIQNTFVLPNPAALPQRENLGQENGAALSAPSSAGNETAPLVGPDNEYMNDIEDLEDFDVGADDKIYSPDDLMLSDFDEVQFNDMFSENIESTFDTTHNTDANVSLENKPISSLQENVLNATQVQNEKQADQNIHQHLNQAKSHTNDLIDRSTSVPLEEIPATVSFHRLTVDHDVTKDGPESAPVYKPQNYPRVGRFTLEDRSVPVTADGNSTKENPVNAGACSKNLHKSNNTPHSAAAFTKQEGSSNQHQNQTYNQNFNKNSNSNQNFNQKQNQQSVATKLPILNLHKRSNSPSINTSGNSSFPKLSPSSSSLPRSSSSNSLQPSSTPNSSNQSSSNSTSQYSNNLSNLLPDSLDSSYYNHPGTSKLQASLSKNTNSNPTTAAVAPSSGRQFGAPRPSNLRNNGGGNQNVNLHNNNNNNNHNIVQANDQRTNFQNYKKRKMVDQ